MTTKQSQPRRQSENDNQLSPTGVPVGDLIHEAVSQRSVIRPSFTRWLASQAGIPASQISTKMKGGRNTEIRGTYYHRDLIVPIASWMSPVFALKVSRIIQSYFAKEALDAKEAEHARIVGEKDLAYAKLSRKMDRQSAKMDRQAEQMSRDFAAQKAETDRVLSAIGFVQEQNVDLKQHSVALESHLVDVKHKLCVASNTRVQPTRKAGDYNILTIVDNGSVFIPKDADSVGH